jgi:hypothetical protein
MGQFRAIKKKKSPQFVVQIKVVVPKSRKMCAILAIKCSGKGGECSGGRSPILICSERGRGQSENYELNAPTTSRFLII